MRRPAYHPLPGISTRDPKFYEGENYTDRDRFAQPMNTGTVIGAGEAPPGTSEGDEQVVDGYPTGINPSPFKLGGL